MSRSRRGSKSPGYDFWSRRPGSGSGHGPSAKQKTKGIERMQRKKIIKEEIEKAQRGEDE